MFNSSTVISVVKSLSRHQDYGSMKNKLTDTLFILILICFTMLQTSCNDEKTKRTEQSTEIIHLNQLAPLQQTAEITPRKTFKVAVAAILSPRGTAESYQPFLEYLGNRLATPVQLVQRRTYQEINDLVARNRVDMAFVCTGAFMDGLQKSQMKLLAIPQINGKRTYNALIIVPKSSQTYTFEELRGHIFAFTDPLSNTGYLYPLSLLTKHGWSRQSFFKRTLLTYSHDHSIAAVAEGIADGASVDSLVYEYAVKRDPSLTRKTRIILRSPDFGMPPVVVSTLAQNKEVQKIRHIMVSMNMNAEGISILEQLGVDRFFPPDYSLYTTKMTTSRKPITR